MEKVIAYKSFDGKLFLTEKKCLEYEDEIRQYPKVTETVTKADPVYRRQCNKELVDVDIIRHTVTTQEKPSSQKKTDVYYIVGGKYKFSDCDNYRMMVGCIEKCEFDPTDQYWWWIADRAIANYILSGNELNDRTANELVEMFRKTDPYSKMQVTVIEPDKKWKFEDVRWHDGSIRPNFVTIEKL